MKDLINKHSNDLLKKKNVVAVGKGNKWTNGQDVGEDALLVFVEQKEDAAVLSQNDLIPDKIDGVRTDVVGKTGQIQAFSYTGTYRPLIGGVSCGHPWITAGTIGGFFLRNNQIVGLSNNHVLADSNNGRIGHSTLQPGRYDYKGWWRRAIVGRLLDFERIKWSGNNVQDSAIFLPGAGVKVDPRVIEVGSIDGFGQAIVNQDVRKSGRTTGYTTGKVKAINVTVRVGFGSGKVATFVDQIITGDMADGGDSGSLLFNNNDVVGLLFAGSTTTTIYNEIDVVKRRYGLSLINSGSISSESYTYIIAKRGIRSSRRRMNFNSPEEAVEYTKNLGNRYYLTMQFVP